MTNQAFLDDVTRCDALLSSGQTEQAVAAFEALVRDWPENPDACAFLGYAYLAAKRPKDAIAALENGLKADPTHALMRSNMVAALNASEQYREAVPHLIELLTSSDEETHGKHIQLLKDTLSWLDTDAHTVDALSVLISPDQDRDTILAFLPYLERTRSFHACVAAYRALALQSPGDDLVLERLAYYASLSGNSQIAEMASAELRRRIAPLDTNAEAFHDIYDQGLLRTLTPPTERRRARFKSLVDHFLSVAHLEGEIAECGMFRGLSAFVLCSHLKRRDPTYAGADFHGFDSFEGLSDPTAEDEPDAEDKPPALRSGAFACSEGEVRENLADFAALKTYSGWIPDRFAEVANIRFRFVSIDVDLYQPSKASLEFFFPRMVPGGVIICDDYNWPGQARAVREFAEQHGIQFSVTETDQAVLQIAAR